ncbi:hypothetical protein GCM10019991_10230 [Enterococcus casseliflavus]
MSLILWLCLYPRKCSDAFIRTNWRGLLESHEEEKNEKTSFVAIITNTVPDFRMWDDKFSKP